MARRKAEERAKREEEAQRQAEEKRRLEEEEKRLEEERAQKERQEAERLQKQVHKHTLRTRICSCKHKFMLALSKLHCVNVTCTERPKM